MTETNAERLERLKGLVENNYFVGCPGDGTEFHFSEELDWLIEQTGRVQELEIDLNICQMTKSSIESVEKFTKQIKDENRILREALEFYTGEEHYELWQERDGNSLTNEWTNDVTYDGGTKARKALEQFK